MCNCTSGNLEISGLDASHRSGMTDPVFYTLPFSAAPISSSTLGSSIVAGIVH
jgi:hypothetical protein